MTERDLEARIAVLSDALKSISKNTCCDNCQEAARVARSALGAYVGLARDHSGDVAQGPFESREDLAKVIAYELEDGSFHGARVTGPHLDNYHIYGHVNLLALAGAILRRAQPPAAPVETGCTSSDGGGESRPASTEPQASASRRPQGLIGGAGVAPSPSDPQCFRSVPE